MPQKTQTPVTQIPNSFTPGTDTIKLPKIINSDSCAKPRIIQTPKKVSGSYLYTYPDGDTAIIHLKPAIVKSLPIVTRLFQTNDTTDQNAAGKGFFTTYSTDNGLALDVIFCGFRDKTGNLWFGTDGGGVSRYDGKSFTNFTTSNGLINNSVLCIMEDKRGNIWFATAVGISCYDGKSFAHFPEIKGLSNNSVRSIIQDKSGNLWFATGGGGVFKYDWKSFTNITTLHGLLSNNVCSIIEDRKGNLWFGTVGCGVSRYDGKSFTNFTKYQGILDNNVMCITEDKRGNLWFGTMGGGVSRYDGKSFTNFTKSEGLFDNNVVCITEDKKGNLWFGTYSGVCQYDGKFFTNFTKAQGLTNNTIKSITEDKTGNLWIGTYGGGVNRYDGKSIVSFTAALGYGFSNVCSITEDKNGNLWFCTSRGGASCYNGKSFINFTPQQGLADINVRCITEDKIGNLWFGTANAGISCYDGKSFTNFTTSQGLVNNKVWNITEDKNGILWFATMGGGVSRFDGKTFTNYTTAQGLANNKVLSITEDKNGNLWFGTYGGGASRYDGKTFTNFTTSHGLASNEVINITEDICGNLWFGTNGRGVSRYDGQSFTNFTTKNGLPNNSISQVVILNEKIIFGSNYGVAVLLNFIKKNGKSLLFPQNDLKNEELKNYNPVFEIYNSITGYPIKDINGGQHAMFTDSKGIIWAATGSDKTALIRLDYNAILKRNKHPDVVLHNLKVNNEKICWYNLAQVALCSTKGGGQRMVKSPSCDLGSDSLALINEEFLIFNKELTDSERIVMQHKFTGIKFDGISKFYPLPQNLQLTNKQNNITIEFSAIEPARPFLVKYQYMLEGYDDGWSPATDKTTATFGNIFEGTYTFKVRALFTGASTLNEADGWSEPVTYTFKVLPPWYRTWWMYSTYVIVLLSSLYLVYRIRVAKFVKENQILEEKVILRTEQLQMANEEITAQRDLVTLQKEEIEEQRDLVTHQKERIEEIYKEISDSIIYAKRIQQAVLPNLAEILSTKIQIPNTTLPAGRQEIQGALEFEFFILFKPRDIVSGDFYWATKNNEFLIVTIADCTGHGVPGAFMSMLGISFLNEIVRKKEVTKASEVLNYLRESVIDALKQQGVTGESKDGMDIAFCVINTGTMEMMFAGANNPVYIVSSRQSTVISQLPLAAANCQLIELKGDKQPIGIYTNMHSFTNNIIQLQHGDIIYLASDGYEDQFGGPKGKKFLSKKLKQLLIENYNKPMSEQKETLNTTIENWKNNYSEKYDQTDDITIMGIRIK